MIKEHIINLNIKGSSNLSPTVVCTRGDVNSNLFTINLTDNNVPINLTNQIVTIVFKKGDNRLITQTCDIDNVSFGRVSVILASQVLAVLGAVESEIVVFGMNGERLSSCSFSFNVTDSLLNGDVIESTNEFKNLVSAIIDLEVIKDATIEATENADNVAADTLVVKNDTIVAKNNAISAKNDTIEATNNAVSATNAINIINENMSVWEEFDPLKIYKQLNKIVYNGDSFICIEETVAGTYPTNTTYFIPISRHGKDGISILLTSKYVATNSTSHAIHGLTMYDNSELQVFYKGLMLDDSQYTLNVDGLSIDFVGFSLEVGDLVVFKLYQSYTESSLQILIDQALILRDELETNIDIATSTKNALQSVINTANTTTYATQGDLSNKIKVVIYTATGTTSNATHNFSTYDSLHDELEVVDLMYGDVLTKGVNYNEVTNGITLIGWSLALNDKIKFTLYKNVK